MLDKQSHRRAREVITVAVVSIALLAAGCVALGAGQLVMGGRTTTDAMRSTSANSALSAIADRLHRFSFNPDARRNRGTTHTSPAPAPTTTQPASTTTTPPTAGDPHTTDPQPIVPVTQPTTPLTDPPTTTPPTTPATDPPVAAGPPGTQMLFDDEFDGSSLDTSKWQPNWLGNNNSTITKPINSSEVSCYDPSQVSVSGGSLHLDAANRSCTANNGQTFSYASGLVNTLGHFTFTYGHMEARVCVPGSGAITDWPAFWADGTGNWPTTGELDVMEGLSGHAAGHFHSPSGGPGVNAPSSINGAGCHVYAADWAPGRVTFVYDGQTIGSITSGITNAPMYLILNLGVGGSGGAIQAPASMTVDYVRVWKTS